MRPYGAVALRARLQAPRCLFCGCCLWACMLSLSLSLSSLSLSPSLPPSLPLPLSRFIFSLAQAAAPGDGEADELGPTGKGFVGVMAKPLDGDFEPKIGEQLCITLPSSRTALHFPPPLLLRGLTARGGADFRCTITSSGKNFSFADDCIYIKNELRDAQAQPRPPAPHPCCRQRPPMLHSDSQSVHPNVSFSLTCLCTARRVSAGCGWATSSPSIPHTTSCARTGYRPPSPSLPLHKASL
jgi:hypothetical protein